MEKQQLLVEGMTCNHCANRVARALKEVPGVLHAQVDLAGASAEVTSESPIPAGTLVAAVEKKGYSARPVL